MIAEASYQRGMVLFEQGRYADAEREMRLVIGAQPHNPLAYCFLALCLAERKAYADAAGAADQATAIAPDLPFAHYARAKVAYDRDRYDEAEFALREAVRLEPHNPDYFHLLGATRFERKQWPGALEAADQGLAVDPEHAGCVNLRAMALVKLGRKAEAGAAIGAALAKDPDNAVTHANQGWTLLHAGEHRPALEHFREALRLDPELEWARAGIVEALKARHLVYRVMLRYFLWMSGLSDGAQWAIILGGWFGYRVVSGLQRDNPAVRPFVLPLMIAYVAFAVMTWLADPLFNLLLRLNRFGRLVLSRRQTIAANVTGSLLLAALVSLAAGLWSGDVRLLMAAGAFGLLALPTSSAFRMPDGWPTVVMAAACVLLAVVGLAGPGMMFLAPGFHDGQRSAWIGLGSRLFTAFLWGVMLSTFLSNYLRGVTVRK